MSFSKRFSSLIVMSFEVILYIESNNEIGLYDNGIFGSFSFLRIGIMVHIFITIGTSPVSRIEFTIWIQMCNKYSVWSSWWWHDTFWNLICFFRIIIGQHYAVDNGLIGLLSFGVFVVVCLLCKTIFWRCIFLFYGQNRLKMTDRTLSWLS